MAENSQYEQIKKYLEDGNKITGLDALRKFGCYRLSAVIFKLRQNGYPIETHDKKVKKGTIIAEYEMTYDKTV